MTTLLGRRGDYGRSRVIFTKPFFVKPWSCHSIYGGDPGHFARPIFRSVCGEEFEQPERRPDLLAEGLETSRGGKRHAATSMRNLACGRTVHAGPRHQFCFFFATLLASSQVD